MIEYGYDKISQEWKDILDCTAETFEPLIGKNTFNAFTYCKPSDIKVVIIGQDPYPDKITNGLAFSCEGYKVANRTITNCLKRANLLDQNCVKTNLEPWAHKGVLLLNAMLTTPKINNKDKELHTFWLIYTTRVINWLMENTECKFLVWGKFAESLISSYHNKERIYIYHHPTAKKGVWNCPDFDKCNIDWSL